MDEIKEKKRCQSCGMPLGTIGFFGSNKDGSENTDYCKFCFQKGVFTDPDMTLEQMITSSVSYMTKGLKIPEDKSRELSNFIIPTLSRWKR